MLAAVRHEQPDLVLIDIGYPQMSGIGVGQTCATAPPATPIVFCSIADDDDTAIRALSVGAVGYVSKDLSADALRRALRGALDGEAAISRRLARRLRRGALPPSEPRPRLRPLGGELTAREWEVLDLLIDGESTTRSPTRLGPRARDRPQPHQARAAQARRRHPRRGRRDRPAAARAARLSARDVPPGRQALDSGERSLPGRAHPHQRGGGRDVK